MQLASVPLYMDWANTVPYEDRVRTIPWPSGTNACVSEVQEVRLPLTNQHSD